MISQRGENTECEEAHVQQVFKGASTHETLPSFRQFAGTLQPLVQEQFQETKDENRRTSSSSTHCSSNEIR